MSLKEGSLWIVFIPYAQRNKGLLEPYPGPDGMNEFNRTNFEKVLVGLEERFHLHYDRKKTDKLFDQIDSREHTFGDLNRDLSQ